MPPWFPKRLDPPTSQRLPTCVMASTPTISHAPVLLPPPPCHPSFQVFILPSDCFSEGESGRIPTSQISKLRLIPNHPPGRGRPIAHFHLSLCTSHSFNNHSPPTVTYTHRDTHRDTHRQETWTWGDCCKSPQPNQDALQLPPNCE